MSSTLPPPTIELAETAATLARAAERLAVLATRLASQHQPLAPRPLSVPPPAVSALPEYLDTKAAARVLGVSPKGLEAMRQRGAGPKYIRIGNRVRYRREDLPGTG